MRSPPKQFWHWICFAWRVLPSPIRAGSSGQRFLCRCSLYATMSGCLHTLPRLVVYDCVHICWVGFSGCCSPNHLQDTRAGIPQNCCGHCRETAGGDCRGRLPGKLGVLGNLAGDLLEGLRGESKIAHASCNLEKWHSFLQSPQQFP